MSKSSQFQTRRVEVPIQKTYKPAQPFARHSFKRDVEYIDDAVPKVFITREAFSRMWHFVDIANEEVSWLGSAVVLPGGDFLIEEVFLLEQEVTSVSTTLSTEGQATLVEELLANREDGMDIVNKLLFWGHSHVNMGTSPSTQDEDQMDAFKENDCPWFIRGILNKCGRMEFTLFLWEEGIRINDAEWSLYERVDEDLRQEVEDEFKEKVSTKKYKMPSRLVGVSSDKREFTYPIVPGMNVQEDGEDIPNGD